MKSLSFFICSWLLVAACKKNSIETERVQTFTISSSINNGTYEIKVVLPKNYSPQKKYATLYVLDPKWDLDFVVSEGDKQALKQQKDGVLVIGIGWGHDRVHDYAPVPLRGGKGGADAFARFIGEELVPKIEKDYSVALDRAHRGIIGHSAGGLFVAHCFVSHNELFGHYMALSPSLWVGDQVVLINEKERRSENTAGNGSFFLAVGELEQEVMQPPIALFQKTLSDYYPHYIQQFHIARGLDHMGSKNSTIPKALTFYFQQL